MAKRLLLYSRLKLAAEQRRRNKAPALAKNDLRPKLRVVHAYVARTMPRRWQKSPCTHASSCTATALSPERCPDAGKKKLLLAGCVVVGSHRVSPEQCPDAGKNLPEVADIIHQPMQIVARTMPRRWQKSLFNSNSLILKQF